MFILYDLYVCNLRIFILDTNFQLIFNNFSFVWVNYNNCIAIVFDSKKRFSSIQFESN